MTQEKKGVTGKILDSLMAAQFDFICMWTKEY